MSDQEMQFFSEENQVPASSQPWSPAQDSAPPVPASRADRQSLDAVWGRLEEHVSRNRAYYQQNRNVPALSQQTLLHEDEGEKLRVPLRARRPVWRRLDTLVAAVFLVLTLGSLLTFAYRAGLQTSQLGAGPVLLPEKQLCQTVQMPNQPLTIIQGKDGLEVLPHQVVIRAGTQLTWVNQTGRGQLVMDASTKDVAMKVDQYQKASMTPLRTGRIYSYYVQSNALKSGVNTPAEKQALSEKSSVQVQVLDVIMLVPSSDGAIFQPGKVSLPAKAPLIWLNTTSETQAVVALNLKQEPLVLAPNTCHLQPSLAPGDYQFSLKGSSAQFALNIMA